MVHNVRNSACGVNFQSVPRKSRLPGHSFYGPRERSLDFTGNPHEFKWSSTKDKKGAVPHQWKSSTYSPPDNTAQVLNSMF